MHSLVARIKGLKVARLNGFSYWQVERDSDRIGIDMIRENYRKSIN